MSPSHWRFILPYGSSINLEFTLGCSFNFIFSQVAIQLSQIPMVEKPVFAPII